MNVEEKGVILLGIIAVAFLLFAFSSSLTGAVYVLCPEGYTYKANYCVEDACYEPGVKCMKQGNMIKRPECVCWRYVDKILCGIRGAEKTSIKSLNCTRQGQVDSICGHYDSNLRMCVSG